MADITFEKIKEYLTDCINHQLRSVTDWHFGEPDYHDEPKEESSLANLRELAGRQHWKNFSLWHVEDDARAIDAGDYVICRCKQKIDGLNQQRNDLIEKIDKCLVEMIMPILPENASQRFNTETLGSVVDRLSIQSLKIYHMKEQVRRKDVDEAHREACQKKVDLLEEQHEDLTRAMLELVDEYAAGTKRPKVYFQFKMYNDPTLNPSLYKNKSE